MVFMTVIPTEAQQAISALVGWWVRIGVLTLLTSSGVSVSEVSVG